MNIDKTQAALSLFNEIVIGLTQPHPLQVLPTYVKKAYQACTLLGLDSDASFFSKELDGFGPTEPLPEHRLGLAATLEWAPASEYDVASFYAYRKTYGNPDLPEAVTRTCLATLEDFCSYSSSGLIGNMGEQRQRQGGHHPFTEKKIVDIPAASFKKALTKLENLLFKYAVNKSSSLAYGSVLNSLFSESFKTVEGAFSTAGLTHQLNTIQKSIASDNVQDWRNQCGPVAICFAT